ncbi:MAG TPA: HD domain-containing protein [Polyangiaceae bacterium]
MILRDPVHGLVAFESAEESLVVELLDAAEVQRLRRVRQLGLASLSYPGADHTRFSHAIGSAFVMTRLLRRLRGIHDELPFWQRVTTERAREALAAALLHDIGHGPYSHLFEELLPKGPRHEDWTARILLDPGTEVNRILTRTDSTLPGRVADLIRGRHELTFMARAVSGTFDVDRCDYLLRDAHFTGVGYGRFDLDWLLRSLRFGLSSDANTAPALAIDGARGLPAIESFILARLFMFQQVYFHKASRASDFLLSRIVSRVGELLADGTRVEAVPAGLAAIARDGDATLGEYLDLDDAAMSRALSAWQSSKDPVLGDLSRRLMARNLFKTYELMGDKATPVVRLELYDLAREIARESGLDPEKYVGLDAPADVPFDDTGEPLTVIFPGDVERRPGDVSFLLGRLRGQKLERVRLVFAPELRERVVSAVGS